MKVPVESIVSAVNDIIGNKEVRRVVLGTYTDGKPRNVIDALNGEIISPEDRLLITRRMERLEKKKKKKKKKKKNKKNNNVVRITHF